MSINQIQGTLCNFKIDMDTIDEKYCNILVLSDNTILRYQAYILMNYSPTFRENPNITLEFLSKQDPKLVRQLFDLLHYGTYKLDINSFYLEEIVKLLKIYKLMLDPCLNMKCLASGLFEKLSYQNSDKLYVIGGTIVLKLSYYICIQIVEQLYDVQIIDPSSKLLLPLDDQIKTVLNNDLFFVNNYFNYPDYEDIIILAKNNGDYYKYFCNRIVEINGSSFVFKKSEHLIKLIGDVVINYKLKVTEKNVKSAVTIFDACNMIRYPNEFKFMETIFMTIMNQIPPFQEYLLNIDLVKQAITSFLSINKINISFEQLCEHFNLMNKHQGTYPESDRLHRVIFIALAKYTDLYLKIILALGNEEINFDQIIYLRNINKEFNKYYDISHCDRNLISVRSFFSASLGTKEISEVCKFLVVLNKYGRINIESLNISNADLKEKLMMELPTLTKPAVKSINK